MELSLLFLNDVHGYVAPHPELFYDGGKEYTASVGGYAAIATKIKEIRGEHPHTMLFDGGDTFHGTLPVVQSKGEALVPVLNHLGFEAMVGHWDFAYGPQQLKRLAAQLSYPVLGINVYNKKGDLFLQPYILREVGGVTVAVIGICSNIIDKTMPPHFSEGITVTDGLDELPRVVAAVKSNGAEVVILLSHNGFPQDMEMVQRVAGIDVCLSAHTHNRLYEPAVANNTMVIQCGCHGAFLGHLQLNIVDGKVTLKQYDLLTIDDSITPDVTVENIILEIMRPYRAMQEEIVGETSIILHRYNTLQSSTDDLLLQSIAHAAGVSIAFSNGWRYGAPIPSGAITKWDLYNIIPVNPVVSVAELTGAEIKAMLEENLERTFSRNPMKQMGGYVKRCIGINVKMRIENPEGNRIQQIFAEGALLQNDKRYKVAYVTAQGVPPQTGTNKTDLPIHAVEAIVAYLASVKTVMPTQEASFSLV